MFSRAGPSGAAVRVANGLATTVTGVASMVALGSRLKVYVSGEGVAWRSDMFVCGMHASLACCTLRSSG